MNWPTSKDPRDHISLVAVPTMAISGESTKLVPEFFYQEAVPPPEVLQPLPPPVQTPAPALPEQPNPPT